MEKKIREGKVGVISSTNYGIDYAKSMNVTNEQIARMDKQLVEFLMRDVDRINKHDFLMLLKEKGIESDGLFDYKSLEVEWITAGEFFYIEEFEGRERVVLQNELYKA
ncbi:hypothetical protein AAK913_12200 [Enterococcus faecium]|uniref:hypothetical protein n=1 Tax=Enterococcus faecium TaxID=1352 RepID=UPI0035141D77